MNVDDYFKKRFLNFVEEQKKDFLDWKKDNLEKNEKDILIIQKFHEELLNDYEELKQKILNIEEDVKNLKSFEQQMNEISELLVSIKDEVK